MAKLKKPNFSNKNSGSKSRKQLRKEKRLSKKERKNEHYKKKFLISNLPQKNDAADGGMFSSTKASKKKARKKKQQQPEENCDRTSPSKPDTQELQKLNHANEINLKKKLEKEMKKQRKIQLLEENKYEDMEIKKLEKQLKMNKRKTKTLPKCFVEEGLDYLLNVCDSEKVKNMLVNQDSDSEFEDDLAMVKGENPAKKAKKSVVTSKMSSDSEDAYSGNEGTDDMSHSDGGDDDDDDDDDIDGDSQYHNKKTKSKKIVQEESQSEEEHLPSGSDFSENNPSEDKREMGSDDDDDDDEQDMENAVEAECLESGDDVDVGQETKSNGKGKYWQDIYGRQRDEKGNVVQSEGKYIPPHLKAKMLGDSSERKEQLARLSKQLKGHINRLAENNMHKIVSEIDQLYMQNSRNDMNETLTKLIFESLIQPVLIPERLVSEHTMLIAALHANVGTEVGAYFLQELVEKFDETLKKGINEDKKDLDNILLVISYLYIFKVCHSVLIFDMLNRICSRDSLGEKEVELLLVVLRSAGFSLRKDDPLALKNLIMKIQTQATNTAHQSRVKFMLDVLIAIKNNNITKVPQYDANRYEHFKKVLKTVVQKGKYISELKISLEDLLNAGDRGRWWIVGSAWAGDKKDASGDYGQPLANSTDSTFSSKLLDLARKQRMNTDARRNLFCILMSAEDYQDAFEKILKLGLKGQQEQEIVNVIMHCSLQEKKYNPYYAFVAAQFCSCNRKFVMMFQYHLWDRFKELKDLKGFQITNMAKFLAHLLLQNLLPLSALKVIEFASLEKPSVRLLRQLFLSLLLSDNEEDIATVFSRISQISKFHIFRESIRLFFHHFLLKNISEESPEACLLKKRIQMAENLLMGVNINDNPNSKFF